MVNGPLLTGTLKMKMVTHQRLVDTQQRADYKMAMGLQCRKGGGDNAQIGSLGDRQLYINTNISFVVYIKEHPLIRVFFYIHTVTKVYNL